MKRKIQHGMTLLEVLVAASLLGVAFAALFGAFSTSLRTIERLQTRERVLAFAEAQMNELLLTDLQPGAHLGGLGGDGARWEATAELFDRIRPEEPMASTPVVLLVRLTVFWPGQRGEQKLTLETLKISRPQERRE